MNRDMALAVVEVDVYLEAGVDADVGRKVVDLKGEWHTGC